ncbi:MAG: M20/M25/M40 family metallo-hydrolase [Burkholderiales bacterium]
MYKLICLVLFLCGAGCHAWADAAAPLSPAQPRIQQIVREISADNIERSIRKLVSFGTRHTASETESDTRGIGAARRWIKQQLDACSAANDGRLQVEFDEFVQQPMARIRQPLKIVNVVATLPGRQAESKERVYVVSGHYDSMCGDVMDEKCDAPGANDDASGTAAVMEIACVMAKHEFDATLVFMAVAGEEQGLLGATHWADKAHKDKRNIAGMFTNDIIGSSRADDGRIDKSQVRVFAEGVPAASEMADDLRKRIATGGENDSPTRQLARFIKESAESYVAGMKVALVYRRDRYLRGGDHMPFLERGFPAVRFSEINEDYRHQHQNARVENNVQFGDLPEFVDFDYTANVARINAAALAALALGPAMPARVEIETIKLENDTTLRWQANVEPDLAGYEILWRDTTAPFWQGRQSVGNVTRHTVKGRSKDNYIFGVRAIDKDGNAGVASYPLPYRP